MRYCTHWHFDQVHICEWCSSQCFQALFILYTIYYWLGHSHDRLMENPYDYMITLHDKVIKFLEQLLWEWLKRISKSIALLVHYPIIHYPVCSVASCMCFWHKYHRTCHLINAFYNKMQLKCSQLPLHTTSGVFRI